MAATEDAGGARDGFRRRGQGQSGWQAMTRAVKKDGVNNGRQETAATMSELMTVVHDGRRYTWDGVRWVGDDHTIPPRAMIVILNGLCAERRRVADAGVTDLEELLRRAKRVRDVGDLDYAQELVERV